MTGNFIDNGDGTGTVSFSFTAPLEKVQKVIETASKNIYNEQPIVQVDENDPLNPIVIGYDTLTMLQKLDVVDVFVKTRVMEQARDRLVTDAIEVAHDTANADDSIDLG